ncbi:hypothetical protein P8452_75677 [Trifolium repens]|nr:hypothetical protein P8452_75677 [Trifolium repens]
MFEILSPIFTIRVSENHKIKSSRDAGNTSFFDRCCAFIFYTAWGQKANLDILNMHTGAKFEKRSQPWRTTIDPAHIDTVAVTSPAPLDANLVVSVMSMWTGLQPAYYANMWNEALHKQSGTELI